MTAAATRTLEVGDKAPDFRLPSAADGREWSLSACLRKRPVLLVSIRGTW